MKNFKMLIFIAIAAAIFMVSQAYAQGTGRDYWEEREGWRQNEPEKYNPNVSMYGDYGRGEYSGWNWNYSPDYYGDRDYGRGYYGDRDMSRGERAYRDYRNRGYGGTYWDDRERFQQREPLRYDPNISMYGYYGQGQYYDDYYADRDYRRDYYEDRDRRGYYGDRGDMSRGSYHERGEGWRQNKPFTYEPNTSMYGDYGRGRGDYKGESDWGHRGGR